MIGRFRASPVLMTACLALAASTMAQRSNDFQFNILTNQRLNSVMRCHEVESLFEYDLPEVLKVRVPGTPEHEVVKNYIVSRLNQLNCSRWNITQHSFEQDTPYADIPRTRFTNIIATLDPEVDKRLVLAAHYDSKRTPRGFLGATDSALPVALLLDMALTLDEKLQNRGLSEYSLQLIFFDGEEAFQRWTATDSLYGSRQLARDMEDTSLLSVGDKTALQAMEAFVLLDLIGAQNPTFHNMFESTTNLYGRLARIEQRLHDSNHLESHSQPYFVSQQLRSLQIEDDHKPFLERGNSTHTHPTRFLN
ncbi:Glutaminyl-peptide cyclotransferase [Geodia barretti]|uniref:glutaminyl-peptide cyclotransferase n=1 Tax=Geodia barretti TaxID=519541 RepID=A0AA35R798_GEOBA|nr:Glutaminyl-peptide cyclotransferase [Geodia barretti]